MMILGFFLLLLVLAAAVAIGYKANQSVRNFDERSHESFIGHKAKK
ncbi:hypothetical protein [Brevibacillus massiliensis]|jgi:hypothetical protein|nr:hypothetical protein [Brevibacillus massiliensis]